MRRPGKRGTAVTILYAVVTAAMLVAYGLLDGHALTQALLYSAIAVGAAVAIVLGVLRRVHRSRLPWLLLGLSMGCWASGDITWSLIDVEGDVPYPSFADPFYILGYLFLAAGLLGVIMAGRRRREVVADLIDVSIISLCVALAAWPFVFEPTLADGWSSSAAVTVTYAGGDILMLGLLAALILNPLKRTLAIVFVAAAVVAVFLADVIFYVPSLALVGSVEKWSNLTWLLGYLLIGIAGLHGSNLHEKGDSRQRSRPLMRRLISVGLILLALPGALVLDAMTGDGFEGDEWAVFATAFVLVLGLIVARAMILITEIEQSRVRNRRMRLRLQTVFESAGVGIVIRESDYMSETNSAFQAMLGYTGEELAELRFFDVVHPDDLEDATAATNLEFGARSTVDRRFIHQDGSTVVGRVTHSTASEERLHIAVIEDITMKAHQERQIQEGQKLEAIGRLAGGIAHDFNNLLTAVNGHAELIRVAESRADVEESATIIIEASGRAAALTRQLLTFSRQNQFTLEEVETTSLLRRTAELLRRVLPASVRTDLRVDGNAPSIVADPTQIDQVLLNLALNASDAMPDGGTLTLSVDAFTPSRLDPRHSAIADGLYCRITVSDTGEGMTESTLARIFEPFFTTKEVGKGTGLGLATTHGIVSQSGGHILVASKPSFGTTFEVVLPAAPSTVPSDRALQPPPSVTLTPRSGPARGRSVRAARRRAGSADDLEVVERNV
jgi:PAS domain S-box-containing protein